MTELVGQLPALQPGEMERWLMSAAAVGGIVLMWLRLSGKRLNGNGEYVSREEFRQHRVSVQVEIGGLRDRIDSRHLAMIEKLEEVQASLGTEAERRAAALHRRLGEIEAGVARLDERTKK